MTYTVPRGSVLEWVAVLVVLPGPLFWVLMGVAGAVFYSDDAEELISSVVCWALITVLNWVFIYLRRGAPPPARESSPRSWVRGTERLFRVSGIAAIVLGLFGMLTSALITLSEDSPIGGWGECVLMSAAFLHSFAFMAVALPFAWRHLRESGYFEFCKRHALVVTFSFGMLPLLVPFFMAVVAGTYYVWRYAGCLSRLREHA